MAVTDGLGDLYALLGVGPEASDDEIKRAYRARARELHPDTNQGDPEAEARFKQVTVAYEVLRDPERRGRYDRFGPEGVFGAQPGGGGGFGFEGGLGDIFEAFFGQMGGTGARRRGPQVGADAEVRLELEFAEAVFGSRKEISIRLPATCATCQGRGTAEGTEPVTCIDCQGSGELRRVRQSLLGQVVTSVACTRCSGTGEMIPNPCADCRGEGRRMEESTFTVEVPAGVEEGSTLRLAGRGAAGQRGGPNGSLFVHLVINPDERFERQADNLHTTLTISVAQAALGTEADVETLDGPQHMTIGPPR
jgi:molecular chaperone DnaJ